MAEFVQVLEADHPPGRLFRTKIGFFGTGKVMDSNNKMLFDTYIRSGDLQTSLHGCYFSV